MLLDRMRVGKLQSSKDAIEMPPIQLIVLAVCFRQMQACDPEGMKIVYKLADLKVLIFSWPDTPMTGILLGSASFDG